MQELLSLVVFLLVLGLAALALVLARLLGRVRRLEEALRTRESAPQPAPPSPIPSAPPPPATPPVSLAPTIAPVAPTARRDAEEWVGGTWLQNIGSLLLLLGVFFLLIWGYTTGRVGPTGLVVAGVLAGALFAWRGDRVARTLPGFGHALVGIGIGAAYLSLHVGHFVLHVYGPVLAYPLLALASFAAILAGLRYRVQVIAFLGVAGAFVPWIAAILTGVPGEALSAPGLLAYLVLVDAGVWVLAARGGWSGLALAALLLSAGTWVTVLGRTPWSAPVELGLAALFVALGLAALPRAVEHERNPDALDLAVVALAPYALLVASWPWFAAASRPAAAALLLALAVVYAAAALWIDRRRKRRDLWSLLAFAAAAFAAGALERVTGTTFTPLAWCVQGVVLVALGLLPRAGALRVAGYLVGAFGICFGLPGLLGGLGDPPLPVFTAVSLRSLVLASAALLAAHLLARHADRLEEGERQFLPPLASAAAHALLATWTGLHAWRAVHAFETPGSAAAPWEAGLRTATLTAAAVAGLWLAQAVAVVFRQRDRFALRLPGYALAAAAAMPFVGSLGGFAAWDHLAGSPLHALMATTLAALGLGLALAELLSRERARLGPLEQRAPEAATLVVHVLWLAWSVAAADSVARAVAPARGSAAIVAAGLASAAWLAQAIVLFARGWRSGSAFLRWVGLGTFGLTILKFVLVDLSRVDAFWRFVTAIAVGGALLVVSYVYQRARRRRASALASPPAPATLHSHERSDDPADPPRP